MKVAVAIKTTALDSFVSGRFERVKWFVIFDIDTNKFNFIKNFQEANVQNIINDFKKNDVEAIISDGYGPRALNELVQNGFKAYNASQISVVDVLEKFKRNKLKELDVIRV